MKCQTCEQLKVETLAIAEGAAPIRLEGFTITDRIHALHGALEKLLTEMNSTRGFILADLFVKE